MTVIPYGDAGMAGIQTESFTPFPELFGGSTPELVSENFDAASSAADIPIGSVVGFTGNVVTGGLVLANTSGPIKPIGVTLAPLVTGATDLSIPVATSGCFNVDALTYHADYDTPAKKLQAFEAATRVLTSIKLVKFAYAGIVSNPTS